MPEMTDRARGLRRRMRGWFAGIRRRGILGAVVAAHIVTLAVVLVRELGGLQPFELWVYDRLVAAWAGHAANDRVVLVGVNEADLKRWGYPVPDGVLADL